MHGGAERLDSVQVVALESPLKTKTGNVSIQSKPN